MNKISKTMDIDEFYEKFNVVAAGLPNGVYEMFDRIQDGTYRSLIDTGGLSVNARCMVVAPSMEQVLKMLADCDPAASGHASDAHILVLSC